MTMGGGRGNGINVKVDGNADLSKLIREFEKAQAKARGLGEEIAKAKGEVGQLDQFRGKLGEAVGGWGRQAMQQVGGMLGGAFGGAAMFGQVRGGLERYKDQLILLDNESRTVKRLGQDYRELQNQINETGRAYGFTTREVTALASALGRTYGRAGADRVLGEMQLAQGFARGYGMSAGEGGAVFERAARSGMTTEGGDVSPRQFAALIADAVVAGGMQGRESEVIAAIQGLGDQINSRIIGYQGTQLASEALATLDRTGIRGLQGEQGAQMLGRLNSAIMQPGGGEAGNLFMYQALTGGQGGMNMADYEYLREEGLAGQGPTGKSNLQATMEAINKMPVSGRYRLMAARELTGLSMHEYEGLEQAFFKDGKFDMAKLGGLEQRLGSEGLNQVDASVWGLLAELNQGGDQAAIGREFEQLSGQKADTSSRDALFNQIAGYGRENVALSEGQEREKLDADIAKAAEAAGSKLYELEKAATQAALALLEITGSAPGPLGGIAPIVAGAAAGQIGGQVAGMAGRGIGRLFGMGGAAAGGAGAAGAAGAGGAAAAGGTAAAGAAGGGLLASGAAIAGGLSLGAAGAGAGSLFAEHALGLPGLFGEEQRAAMGAGVSRIDALARGSGDQNFAGDLGTAAGGIAASIWSVPIGVGMGLGRVAQGGDFRQGYFQGFGMANPFASSMWGGNTPGQQQQAPDPAALDALLIGSALEGKGATIAGLAAQHGMPLPQALSMLGGQAAGLSPGSPEVDSLIGRFFASLSDPQAGSLLFRGQVGALLDQHAGPVPGGTLAPTPTIPSSRGGWYNVGEDDQPALLHRREMVLPAPIAELMRGLLETAQRPRTPEPSSSGYAAPAGQLPPAAMLSPALMREANQEIRIRIEPITVQFPDGSSQQIAADGATDDPFAGIIDEPINTTGGTP